ncbi:MAG: hypothetical protein ABI353_09870 [Isosphaeraceae bacterium]
MLDMHYVRIICVLGPILSLLVLGFGIALWSGVANLTSGEGIRLVMGNLSRTLLVVAAVLVVLAILQQVVGTSLAWGR